MKSVQSELTCRERIQTLNEREIITIAEFQPAELLAHDASRKSAIFSLVK